MRTQLKCLLVILLSLLALRQVESRRVLARSKIAPDLHAFYANATPTQTTEFWVVLNQQAETQSLLSQPETVADWHALGWAVYRRLTSTATRTQAPIIAELKRRGLSYRSFWLVNQVLVTGRAADIESFGARADVSAVRGNMQPFRTDLPDSEASSLQPPRTGLLGSTAGTPEWNISWINAPQVWQLGTRGQGIIVASADTGAQWDHPALKSSYAGNGSTVNHNYHWWDAIHTQQALTPNVNCSYSSPTPCDDHGHGSHTIGTMVGDEISGRSIGVAPAAKWISCRNMDSGYGTPSSYLECLQFFIAPTDLSGANANPDYRPHIVNNSYACNEAGCGYNTLHTALSNLMAAGIMVVAAAGNSGSNCFTMYDPPGSDPLSFAVGATNASSNEIASFSSRGSITYDGITYIKPDLVAPGVSIFSADRNNGQGIKSGTSMASPHVAGAIALLWSAYPEYIGKIVATQNLLKNSTQPLYTTQGCNGDSASSRPNNVYGWGMLNVLAAYQLADQNRNHYYLPIMKHN